MKFNIRLIFVAILCIIMGSDLVEAKKKKEKTPGGMQGSRKCPSSMCLTNLDSFRGAEDPNDLYYD